MFNRSEEKIKAVFKLRFKATQVPQTKEKKGLIISLVPVDVGKATVRLAKAPIIQGTCVWEHAVYESVKLVREIKTGKIKGKSYYVVVSTGSSKAGFVGEVSIDFADLAEAIRPTTLKLPLQTSKSGTVLHITVQRMQGGTDLRHDCEESWGWDDSYDQSTDTSGNLSEAKSPRDGQDSVNDESTSKHKGISDVKYVTLKNQIKMLEKKVKLQDIEVFSLRKKITKETTQRQNLSENITGLKEERDTPNVACEQSKSSSKYKNEEPVSRHTSLLEDIKQQLQREKQLNKKLRLELQKKEDSNSEFVISMRDLTKKLQHKNAEISRLSCKVKAFYSGSDPLAAYPRTEMDGNEESKPPNYHQDAAEILEQEIKELNSEITVLKKEKAELTMEIQQFCLDRQSLEMENTEIISQLEHANKEKLELQENYDETLATMKHFKLRVSSLEEELKRQKHHYSEDIKIISELENQVENLEKEIENQAQVFAEDLERVTEAKIEQEQRATKAEEARQTLSNNCNASEKIHEEFKQIYAEMSSRIEENEKLSEKAFSEANDLRNKNETLEEQLQKAKEELQTQKDLNEKLLQEQNDIRDESGELENLIVEKKDLERELASVKKEADKLKHEFVSMKSQVDQKKSKEENLQLEVKQLRLKNSEVRNQLRQLESEKQELTKEISKLQDGQREKEQGQHKASKEHGIRQSGDVSSTYEVASLKERNKIMENELKEMHERYLEVSLRFAEVEGERQQLVMDLRNLRSGKKN